MQKREMVKKTLDMNIQLHQSGSFGIRTLNFAKPVQRSSN